MKQARNFREYKVWQDAVSFATLVYEVCSSLPWFERKGISDLLQRAVVSISSNVAEGAARPSDVEFVRFLDISLGSAFEVETQLLICKNIGYVENSVYLNLIDKLTGIGKQLQGLIKSIRANN